MAVSSPDMSTETPASDELEARVRALEAETIAAREALEAATPTLPEVPASDASPAVPPEELASDATPTPPEPPASDETPAVLPEPPASDETPAVLPEPPASDAAPAVPPEPPASSLLVASDDPSLHALVAEAPDAPMAELRRFARARPGKPADAVAMYREHVRWAAAEGASDKLARAAEAIPKNWIDSSHGGVARDGTRVVYVQGARYDLTLAPEEYTHAICHVLEATTRATSEEKVTVLLDVRTGDGWLNPPAQKLLPFFKHMAKVVPNHYPERLKRVVIYPLPWIVAALIKVVKNLFDPVTREKFIVLSGSDKTGAPCPVDLGEYVTRAGLPDHGRAIHAELPEADEPAADC